MTIRHLTLTLLLPFVLIGCTSTGRLVVQDIVNPHQPTLTLDEHSPEAPPVAAMLIVEDVGIVIGLNPPTFTLGRRSVRVTASRGTTDGDAISVQDVTGVGGPDGSEVKLGTEATVEPTDADILPMANVSAIIMD